MEVKALPCNGWGLYQMHGNVWEWCQDRYGDYPSETVIDPTGPVESVRRVLRGGSWFDYGWLVRSAYRSRVDPGPRRDYYGFRLARGQTARQDEPEVRAASKVSPPVPEAPEASGERGAGQTTRSGGGQAPRTWWKDLLKWIKPK